MEYVPAKTIVTRTKSTGWFGSDYRMNLYRGCCHGCIYCDSRSACYRIEDFDRVRAKQDALRIVRDDLRRKLRPGVVATGGMSDPYNPFERELLLTRHALELIDAYGFGAAIATKGDLVVRDIDILQAIGEHSPVLCKLTITAADDTLAAKVEPGAPPSSARFAALEKLAREGIFSGVLLMPVLPWLEDSPQNLMEIIRRAAGSGARFVYPAIGLTMREGQRDYFYQKLDEQFPGQGLAARYAKRYGGRYLCAAPGARALWEQVRAECDRLGLLYKMREIIRAYKAGYSGRQLTFFDPC